jgi:hypothetical protein
MKRFVFRLARLERIRELKRREARGVLVGALAHARDCSARREAEQELLEEARLTELAENERSDPAAWRRLADWRVGRARLVRHWQDQEAIAAERARRAAIEHEAALRSHRAMVRLRETRFSRWLAEAELEERKSLDEGHLLRLVGRRGTKEK